MGLGDIEEDDESDSNSTQSSSTNNSNTDGKGVLVEQSNAPSCPSCGYGGLRTEGHGVRCDNQGCEVVTFIPFDETDKTKSQIPTEQVAPKKDEIDVTDDGDDDEDIDDFLDTYDI